SPDVATLTGRRGAGARAGPATSDKDRAPTNPERPTHSQRLAQPEAATPALLSCPDASVAAAAVHGDAHGDVLLGVAAGRLEGAGRRGRAAAAGPGPARLGLRRPDPVLPPCLRH